MLKVGLLETCLRLYIPIVNLFFLWAYKITNTFRLVGDKKDYLYCKLRYVTLNVRCDKEFKIDIVV